MTKIDLHTHTISTASDYDFTFDLTKVTEYVEKLKNDALDITIHNEFDLKQYYEIKNVISIPIFPGIEIDLEGGHILVITDIDDFEISNFDQKCKLVSAKITTNTDFLTLDEFNAIFPDLSKYILIPHYDKNPVIKDDVISRLAPHITAGEVASISKFKRLFKQENDLVPVLFSDMRFRSDLNNFSTRHTFFDLSEITLAGLKSCLADKSKLALSEEDGNDFFQATDDGLKLSTGINIILGRSEEHTSELQSRENLVCRLLLEKKKTPHKTKQARG